jgi:hypothetical protein
MIDIPGNWELAKAMPTQDQIKWRADAEWRLANERVEQLRKEGANVTIAPGANGRPVITVTPL